MNLLPALATSALLLGPAHAAQPAAPAPARPGDAHAQGIDWEAAGEETARMLSGLLRTDTLNPPGNETQGAVYLAAWLAREGIASEILEFAPGRGSLIARLPATARAATGPPICLLSHLDVATAEPDRWPDDKGPLSGAIDDDGMVWGRGALDMKGLTALQAMAMALMARRGTPLQRDLILLAVADEEVGNGGIDHVLDQAWDDIGCSHVINEGGMGISDMLLEGQDVYTISVGEKGALWARVVATGEPGHGSVPLPEQSPERLLAAVDQIRARKPKPQPHDAFYELFENVGAHVGGLAGFVLQRKALVNLLVMGKLKANPLTYAVMTNTANITGYGGAMEPNVVPSESWANLDARLLPGTDPEAFLDELGELVDDPQVRFDVTALVQSNVSEWRGDPLYEALAARSVEGNPRAVAGPVLSPGYTDSAPLRTLGVRAYGFMPVLMPPEQIATMHGDNERVSVAQLTDGLRILTLALLDVVAAPGPAGEPLTALDWPPVWPFDPTGLEVAPLPPQGARLAGEPGDTVPIVLLPSPPPERASATEDQDEDVQTNTSEDQRAAGAPSEG